MNNRPLSYESLKTVVQYLDANLRFRFSKQIPAISTIEKLVPLRINQLFFHPTSIIVDNTMYNLGIYLQYHTDDVPEKNLEDNNKGGVPYDLDQFGVPDRSADEIVTPGDVRVRDRINRLDVFEAFNYAPMEVIERRIRVLEQDLMGSMDNQRYERLHNRATAELLPYHYRRDNVQPPFHRLIQFTITSKNDKTVLRKKYNVKLYEVLKTLTKDFFGNRRSNVIVNHIVIHNTTAVIRLPAGLKFKTRGLSIAGNLARQYETLRSVIEESSYPLDNLNINCKVNDIRYFDHPILRSADKLRLNVFLVNLTWLPILLKLTNREVHVRHEDYSFEGYDCYLVVRNLWETNRQVGTLWSFVIPKEETITKVMMLVRRRLSGELKHERCIIAPMSESSNLKVTYEKVPDTISNKWILKAEVMPVESSKPSE